MGFFKKLFARESVADRIARAKQHVAEGDDALAIRVLINLDEPEALAIPRCRVSTSAFLVQAASC